MSRWMECAVIAAALICAPSIDSLAQVRQSGNVTPTHATAWTTNGTVQDAGSETSPFVTTFGILNGTGTGLCVSSDKSTAAGYQRFCIGTTTSGGALLTTQNFGTAPAQGLSLNLNGSAAALATVVPPTVSGDGACFNNMTGTIIDCGFRPAGNSPLGQVSMVSIPRAGVATVDYTAYSNTGAILTSGTTGAVFATAITAAFQPVTLPGYDLVAGGCDQFGGSNCSMGTSPLSFPAAQGKTVWTGSLDLPSMTFDSCLMCQWRFNGQAQNVLFQPSNVVTDGFVAISDSNYRFGSIGGNDAAVAMTLDAQTHSISQTGFSVTELAYGLVNDFLIKSPGSAGAVQNNTFVLHHSHNTVSSSFQGSVSGTTLTATSVVGTIAIGDTLYDESGVSTVAVATILSQLTGPTGGAGTYQLGSSTTLTTRLMVSIGPGVTYFALGNGAPSGFLQLNSYDAVVVATQGTENGVDTWEKFSFGHLRMSGFTGGTALRFRSGACGNVWSIHTDQSTPSIADANGSNGCVYPNQWYINGIARLTISNAGYIDQSYARNAPTTGFSLTLSDNLFTELIDPAGTLASGIITLPSSPNSGQLVFFPVSQQITTLTLSPNSGQSVAGPTSGTVTPGGGGLCLYRQSSTTWHCAWLPGGGPYPNSMLANSSITLNAGTSTGLTTPGAMSLGSTYTIGTTTDILHYGALGLGVINPPGNLGQLSQLLGANNITGHIIKRNTDTAPTGNFANYTSAANAALWTVDITGTLTVGTWQGTKIGLAFGGTNADLSATGGTSQVLKQVSSGAAVTVGQLGFSDLSGSLAQAQAPTGGTNLQFWQTNGSGTASWASLRQMMTGAGSAVATGATGYFTNGGVCGTETNCRAEAPIAGTFKNLYIHTNQAAGAGQSYTLTLYINGSPTSVTCAVSGASAQDCNDTTHTASITVGQPFNFQMVSSAGATSSGVATWAMEFDNP